MRRKRWWQSKTKWAALIGGLAAGLNSPEIASNVPQAANFAALAASILVPILGGFGLRDAVERDR